MFFTSRAYRGCWYPWLSSHLGIRNRKILVWGLPWVIAPLSLSGLWGTGSPTSLESWLPGPSGIALCWRELPGPSSHFPLKGSPHAMHSRWGGGGVPRPGPQPQFRTTWKGHPSSTGPCGASSGLCYDCSMAQFLPLPILFPSLLTVAFLRETSRKSPLHRPPSAGLFPTELNLKQSVNRRRNHLYQGWSLYDQVKHKYPKFTNFLLHHN